MNHTQPSLFLHSAQLSALQALAALAEHPPNQLVMLSEGAVPPLVKLLWQDAVPQQFREIALMCLHSIAQQDTSMAMIKEANGVAALLLVIHSATQPQVRLWAYNILAKLTQDRACAQDVGNLNGVAGLVAALEAGVQDAGSWAALRVLVNGSDKLCLHLTRALSHVAALPFAKATLLNAGGVELFVEQLKSADFKSTTSSALVVATARALDALGTSPEAGHAIRAAGGIRALVAVLRSKQATWVAAAVIEALTSLADWEENAHELRRAGVLPVLRQLQASRHFNNSLADPLLDKLDLSPRALRCLSSVKQYRSPRQSSGVKFNLEANTISEFDMDADWPVTPNFASTALQQELAPWPGGHGGLRNLDEYDEDERHHVLWHLNPLRLVMHILHLVVKVPVGLGHLAGRHIGRHKTASTDDEFDYLPDYSIEDTWANPDIQWSVADLSSAAAREMFRADM
ncbi:hypothetical protein WJX72_008566 [[Myrmecia] bisecta]|uniref:Uncharacterized protein n=1 Tax=[Myrmecia] bisecta TaxID=41462 RepID=A0AAW1Q4F7_9CHLO